MIRIIFALSFVLVSVFTYDSAWAQDYPHRAIRLLVGYPPGGSVDVVARLVGEKLSKELGQPVVIENRPGAAGTIALGELAKAKPDGYTLELVPSPAITISTQIQPISFNPSSDFSSISMVVIGPEVLIARKGFPANSIKELVDYAKANPGKVTFASAGIGGANHMAGELLKKRASVDMVHVPYQGVGPALNNILGEHVDLLFIGVNEAQAHVTSGGVKALGMGSKDRNQGLPDVATISEAGYPDFEAIVWYALMGPAGLPTDVSERLNRSVRAFLTDPATSKDLVERGYDVIPSTQIELASRIANEIMMWKPIISDLGLKP